MILILFGVGVVAQVVTTPDGSLGDHDSIAWAWGLGVTLGVYVAGPDQRRPPQPGGHDRARRVQGLRLAQGRCPTSLAQIAAPSSAALIVRFVYADLIAKVDPTTPSRPRASSRRCRATGRGRQHRHRVRRPDRRHRDPGLRDLRAHRRAANNPPLANLGPLVIGLLVVGIGMAWGTNAGYAINPARDFGPRLASFITGYETAWVGPERHALLLAPDRRARSSAG